MINIYELIYNTLIQLGYEVKEQGSYAENDVLPDTFITYQLINDSHVSHADNLPTSITYRIQVVLYSRDPTIRQAAAITLNSVLLPVRFMRVGGRNLPLIASIRHYGYQCDYRYFDSFI